MTAVELMLLGPNEPMGRYQTGKVHLKPMSQTQRYYVIRLLLSRHFSLLGFVGKSNDHYIFVHVFPAGVCSHVLSLLTGSV